MKNTRKGTLRAGLLVTALALSQAGLADGQPQDTKLLTPLKPTPLATKAEYTVKADEFYNVAKGYGFNVNSHSLAFGSPCEIGNISDAVGGGMYFEVDCRDKLLGGKCDFTVFEPAQLKNGFVFKKFRGDANTTTLKGKAGMDVKSTPAQGSTSVKFLFHGWADPGGRAAYYLRSITLEGPAGRSWKDAVR